MRIRQRKSAKEAVTSKKRAISFNVKKEEIKDFTRKVSTKIEEISKEVQLLQVRVA